MNSLRSLTLFDFYETNAKTRGTNTAIHFQGMDISFNELHDQTRRLAGGLSQLGLSSGSRIAVLSSNHPAFFLLFGAAAALNLTLVLVNRRLSENEISGIIEDTTPEVIVSDAAISDTAINLTRTFDFVNHCFVIDTNDETLSIARLMSGEKIDAPNECRMDDPYLIIHTAAVQGRPRGAVLSHENVVLASLQAAQAFGITESWAHLNILPLFHIMGVNLGLGSFMTGAKNVILDKFDPLKTLDLIQNQHINIIGSFPPILNNLMETAEDGRHDLSSLKIAAGLEQPDTVRKWESMTSSRFWTMYGQTETSGLVTFSEYFARQGSAGKISLLANIGIVDDLDHPLPPGQTGEIVVKGPLVFRGYWKADALNAHTFRDGWHHTGDLGMIDTDGFLFFKGRKAEKELIKPGGENVFPAEVEKVICQHPAIQETCVFGVPDPKFGEGIKAVCVLKPGQSLTDRELIAFTATKIAGYKKPRYVEFVDKLPKTQSGMPDRVAIKQQYT